MATFILPPGGGDIQVRIRQLPDGSTAVDIEATSRTIEPYIGIAAAARTLLEPDLPDDIRRAEQRAAEQRIRRACADGRIRKSGSRVARSDFEAWRTAEEQRFEK